MKTWTAGSIDCSIDYARLCLTNKSKLNVILVF